MDSIVFRRLPPRNFSVTLKIPCTDTKSWISYRTINPFHQTRESVSPSNSTHSFYLVGTFVGSGPGCQVGREQGPS